MPDENLANIPAEVAAQLRSLLCILDFTTTINVMNTGRSLSELQPMILPCSVDFDITAMADCEYVLLIGKIIDCLRITPDIQDVFRSHISDETLDMFLATMPNIRSHSKLELCDKGLQISTPLLFYEIISRPLSVFHSHFELSYRQFREFIAALPAGAGHFVNAKGPTAVSNYIQHYVGAHLGLAVRPLNLEDREKGLLVY